jgi:hypothetical protein
MTQGGKREGSGRKPGAKKIPIATKLLPESIRILIERKEFGHSYGETIDEALRVAFTKWQK